MLPIWKELEYECVHFVPMFQSIDSIPRLNRPWELERDGKEGEREPIRVAFNYRSFQRDDNDETMGR